MARPYLSYGLDHGCRSLSACAESHAALFHIRARYVKFYGMDSRQVRKTFGCSCILVYRSAGYVHHHFRVEIFQQRICFGDEMFHAFVLKPDCIEHSRRRFGHARIRIALTRFQGGAFDYKTAETLEIHEICIFKTVSESTRCRQYWVLKLE